MPRIRPRKMIHDKMLSWQLVSLMMAHSLEMAVTFGGSIVCCGELVASSPKKSHSISEPPALLPLAPPILSAINRGSPCLNVEIEFQDPHTGSHSAPAPYTRLPLTGDKSLMVTLPSVLDSKNPTAYNLSCFTGIGRPVNLSSIAVGPFIQWKPSAGMPVACNQRALPHPSCTKE
ncbi:uncharacterized protein N7500_006224, partial [Penicillium coprophilum]|uniref:uncharacterized protein n=1 Tax=Penicillium coprophilum TaxID=36646 RepID=UPI0023985FF9